MSRRFILRRQVEFNHCDPAGMVFYPRYFEMISATIERFLADEIGYGWADTGVSSGGTGTPMGHIEVRFKAPSLLGDWLDFSLAIQRLGRASATFEIICSGADAPRFTCSATIVHAETGGGRSLPWPDPVRDRMTPFIIAAHDP
ncbi:acyl-CoA thioesterase [Pseudooceanicola sp. C21-150M6]|uniref:acyl-CoA thioesterase n=1 Tax=Pseudooceanicola sp. C21-150M6 TaxID=3434355 RepID=UPI003D7F50F9